MSRLSLRLLLVLSALLVSGCAVNPSGLGQRYLVSWDVVPLYFCAGDTVRASWDMTRIPRSPELCRGNFGGYPTLTRCEVSPDCGDGSCIDGVCCRVGSGAPCPTVAGCTGMYEVTITADTLELEPPVRGLSGYLVGWRDTTPEGNTTYSISGMFGPPWTSFSESRTATLVTPQPPTDHTMRFPFACAGSRSTWLPVDLDTHPIASANVRIIGVRNTSGHPIRLAGGEPGRGPVDLRRGETTELFNGPLAGRWSAALSPLDARFSGLQRCEPTELDSHLADLQIEILLDCEVDD
ncbi:MAG: hypothetical protein ACK4KV_08605 [Rhodocyclaceae bacterium]